MNNDTSNIIILSPSYHRIIHKSKNIYCDESCHLEHDGIKPMLLGCVWCPKDKRDAIFARLREIKNRNGIKPHCELKWNAVSPSKLSYYLDLVDYLFDNNDLHFRALVVLDKTKLNQKWLVEGKCTKTVRNDGERGDG